MVDERHVGGHRRRKQKVDGKAELNCEEDQWSRSFTALVVVTFLLLWTGHYLYLHQLFENLRFFSHLADFEREMTYRTEMGLYYSYYKTVIDAPTLADGLNQLLKDNVTEFGHTINTLQRFNLYPEVTLGAAFRAFKQASQSMGWVVESCWRVNRGEGLTPIESCVGPGNPHYFYVNAVFAIAALTLPTLFLLGTILSASYFGGVLSSAALVFNHGEATRVMWTPPLRESFAYPILLAQILIVSWALKRGRCSPEMFTLLTVLTTLYVLFWQFSNFALATQVGSLLAVYTLDLMPAGLLVKLLNALMTAWVASSAMLFGNSMLLSSLYFTSMMSSYALSMLRPLLDRITFRPVYIALHLTLFTAGVVGMKWILASTLDIRDDNHVMDLLKAKFSNFANFHTQLYLCAVEFGFVEYSTITKLSSTWLLPTSALATVLFAVHLYRTHFGDLNGVMWRRHRSDAAAEGRSAEAVYNVVQMGCFVLMAAVIMRLKLFATPHLCLITSLIASRRVLANTFGVWVSRHRVLLVFAILAGMAYHGTENVREQLAMTGEYSNPEQEDLFNWIAKETPKDAVFAGSMALMANVKLSTLRPIVNHPHYENEENRNRTLDVYSIYSKKPLEEVYAKLKSRGVDYYILQASSCNTAHPKPNCSYIAMWDLIDADNRHNPPVCSLILHTFSASANDRSLIRPMRIVYAPRETDYLVLKL